jgi:hypothetical protein
MTVLTNAAESCSSEFHLQFSVHLGMLQEEVQDGTDSQGCCVRACDQVDEDEVQDHSIVDDIRVGSLGLEKVVQIVWRLGVEIGILSLCTSSDVFQSDAGGVAEVRRADAVNRVLVKPEVQEGQLADGRKAACESVWETAGSIEKLSTY